MKRLPYIILLLFFVVDINAQPSYPTDPEKAQVIYTDIENFLEAFNMLQESSDTLSILETYYFNNGSPGLVEYVNRHGLTAASLATAIKENPETYLMIRKFLAEIPTFNKAVRNEMIEYNKVINEAMYPPTYLIVGANKGIAQASPKGQLITIEKAIDQPDKLIHLISHELSHFQQAKSLGFQNYVKTYSQPNNMLDLILREGGAEFIAYALIGKNKRSYRNKSYFESNEQELKERFLKDLEKQDQAYWLWQSLNQDEYPTLLGYTIGYRICESYYNLAIDKDQALLGILAISDAEAFIKASKYFETPK